MHPLVEGGAVVAVIGYRIAGGTVATTLEHMVDQIARVFIVSCSQVASLVHECTASQ